MAKLTREGEDRAEGRWEGGAYERLLASVSIPGWGSLPPNTASSSPRLSLGKGERGRR